MRRRAMKGMLPLLTGATLAVLLSGLVSAAPVTTNTALPVSKGELIMRKQIIWTHASNDPARLGRTFDAIAGVTVAGYGLTPKLSLFGILPMVHKQLRTSAGRRSSNGLGDARIFARYTIVQQDKPGQSFRIAPFAGVELPTGKHRRRDALGLLPTPLQSGSGTFDPFGGVVATFASTQWQMDVVGSYQINTERDGREDGDVAKFDLSFQYRLWPQSIGADTTAFVFGVLETNLVYQDKQRLNGSDNLDSGGTTLFLAPGLQYAGKTFIAEASVQIPIWQDLNGTTLKKDYITRASVRFNF